MVVSADEDVWRLVLHAIEPQKPELLAFLRKKGIRDALDQESYLHDLMVRLVQYARNRLPSSGAAGSDQVLETPLIWATLRNLFIDDYRRLQRWKGELPDGLAVRDEEGLPMEQTEQVAAAMSLLSESDALLIRQVFFEGCQLVELSQRMQRCPGTISRRLKRIIESLRHSLN